MTKMILVDVKLGIYSLVIIFPAIAFPLEKCIVEKLTAHHAKISDATVLSPISTLCGKWINTNA